MFNKVYSAIYNEDAHLLNKGGSFEVVSKVHELKETKNAVLILHGGSDISPSLYGAKVSRRTHAGPTPSARDNIEVALARRAMEIGLPIFGICRGAQLLCALNGGKLIQDLQHPSQHELQFDDGSVMVTNSCHHQLQDLRNIPKENYDLLGWTKLSPYTLDENDENVALEVEPEVVWYKQCKGFGVQGHPEWLARNNPFVKYLKERLDVLLQS